jgi:S-adenosylmethionine hydrolase
MAGRSNNSFIKKKKAEERIKKRKEKQQKKNERRENSPGGGLDNMIAYVDKFGNISSEPPAEPIIKKKEIKTTKNNQ